MNKYKVYINSGETQIILADAVSVNSSKTSPGLTFIKQGDVSLGEQINEIIAYLPGNLGFIKLEE